MPDVVDLLTAQDRQRQRLTDRATATATAAAEGFTAWYEAAAITAFAERTAGQVEGAQRQLVAVTDAYLARITSELSGRRVNPVGRVDVTGLRAGATHAAVYGRLADQYRRLRADGLDDTEARRRVLTRAGAVADMDMVLAHRAQVHRFTSEREVTGYRRVLRSYGGKTCGLCVAASDRIYHRADLMPIHDRCRCAVMPIVGDSDPGRQLNEEDVRQLYEAADSTKAADLKKVRYVVQQHGELGPILRDKRHKFRGPRKVAADTAA